VNGPAAPEPAAAAAQRLCAALAGSDGVSERLAGAALDRSRRRFGDDVVDQMLEAFAGGGIDALRQGPHDGPARALTYFLYTGVLPDESGRPAPDQTELDEADYFESVMWRAIQAHPRGLSGGYYGHWHYPPEDGDVRRDGSAGADA
jgi:hypothetical protein